MRCTSGTSHRYVAWRSEALLGRPRAETRLVTCHLGAGASVCAIDRGRSIDTSMGFTPLEGLLMGTRAGDLDASLVFHILHAEDLDEHQLTAMLNKHSGLYGLSGISGDMREILAEEAKGHERARLAIDAFCYRLRKYIGAYVAALGGLDALIFTGGIGENAPAIRARALAGLGVLGLEIDEGANDAAIGREARISTAASRAAVLVIPTNEELLIARDTVRLVDGDRA
jgi:acetate kinase